MSDDLISRQAIYDAFESECVGYCGSCEYYDERMDVSHHCKLIDKIPAVQHNPEKDRQESKDYCSDCEHVEMCNWYPTEGCEFRKIKPEQKAGRWIYMRDCEDSWYCSNCKDIFILLEGTPKDNDYNYCPNCGAKMV